MVDISVSREVKEKLEAYQDLLLKWNNKINLISQNSVKEIWQRHIEDSLQLISYLDIDIPLCDVGSGAGLPGIILSIAGVKNITLVESDQRKVSFLLQAKRISDNKVTILNERIEKLDILWEIITCRAFAELNDIFNIIKSKRYLVLKGASYQKEIQKAQNYWFFDYKVYNSYTSSEGFILDIINLRKKHAA